MHRVVQFPIKYLGIPLELRNKNMKTWDPVIELFDRRLLGWKMNYFSVLTMPIKIARKLENIQCRFL